MKHLVIAAFIAAFAGPVLAHLGPDLTQSDITGQPPVRIAISQPISPTVPQVPVGVCPFPNAQQVEVACAN